MPDTGILDAIRRVAIRNGIPPSLMLAIAERESSFNVKGTSGSKYSSAQGLFQLLRGERKKYGGDSLDPEEQSQAWANYIKPVRDEMRHVLGRDPTGPELYTGHYFGGTRAARMIRRYDPSTPVDEIFTPKELAANPNIARAGTSGRLMASITGDIKRRQAKFAEADGNRPIQFDADPGTTKTAALDFSQYGSPVDLTEGGQSAIGDAQLNPEGQKANTPLDLSQFGSPVNLAQADQATTTEQPPPADQPAMQPLDFS